MNCEKAWGLLWAGVHFIFYFFIFSRKVESALCGREEILGVFRSR